VAANVAFSEWTARNYMRLHRERAQLESGNVPDLTSAYRAIGVLTRQKAELAHGERLPWVEGNLPFGRREASNYMRAYGEHRPANGKRVSHLSLTAADTRRRTVETVDAVGDALAAAFAD